MKNTIFWAPVILISTFLSGQNMPEYSVVNIPLQLVENANEIVREDHQTFYVKSLKEGVRNIKQVITILNENSQENELTIYYDLESSKVLRIKARIYDAHGTLIRKVKESEIKDESVLSYSIYDGHRVKTLTMAHNEYPYTISIEYEKNIKGIDFAVFPDWYIQGHRQSVQSGTFIIDVPNEQQFYYQALNIDLNPKIDESSGRKNYTWEVKDLAAIDIESYGPSYSKILPILKTAPEEFQIGRYKGSMANWETYSHFMYQLYEGKDKLPQEVIAKIQALTANATSNVEKINILYQYMQENMRYVSVQLGIGGWEPFDAEYVSRNKYGDCKALTNYMKSMLKEVGITSNPVLIYNGNLHYEVSDTFTTHSFNHVVLNIPSEDYWLECTESYYPPNYLGSSNENRNAVRVTEKGGSLVKTPSLTHLDNLESNSAEVFLSIEGSAKIKNRALFTGAIHEGYRYRTKNYSKAELESWFLNSSPLPSFKIEKLQIEAFDDRPACQMDYEVEIARYGSKAGSRLFVPLNAVNPYSSIPGEVKKRNFPIVVKNAYTDTDTITIHFPDDYAIESIPEEISEVKSSFGYYQIKIEKNKQSVKLTRRLEIQTQELPADQYDDFRNFFIAVAKMDNQTMVLVKKKT